MPHGRLKTYTAQTGYVYQYALIAKKRLSNGTEFLFELSSDRKTFQCIAVMVADEGVICWNELRGRSLVDPEIHAAAKVRLWRALDDPGTPLSAPGNLMVDSSNIAELLDEIGVD